MFIKLLGENENGFPQDCTVGKVYEFAGTDSDGCSYSKDDVQESNYAYNPHIKSSRGKFVVVDKEGNVL